MQIGCGCVNLGSASSGHSGAEGVRFIHAAIDHGISHFDTADAYGNGASERTLGRALRGHRDKVVIATKGGYCFRERTPLEQQARRLAKRLRSGGAGRPAPLTAPASQGAGGSGAYQQQDFRPSHLRAALEASLRRLGVDHVDIYQLHGPPELYEGLLDELVDLRTAGKVRAFGVGAESLSSAAAWSQVPELGCLQLPFGLLDPAASDKIIPSAVAAGKQVWVRGVLGGGVLNAAGRGLDQIEGHPKYRTVAELVDIGQRYEMQLDELALRWVGQFPGIDVMLVGTSSVEHLARNVELVAMPVLSDELLAEVAAALSHVPMEESP